MTKVIKFIKISFKNKFINKIIGQYDLLYEV